jgi:anti-anti-sigma factor
VCDLSDEKPVKCWEYFKCDKTDCPAYGSDELRCWLIPDTLCRDEIAGSYLEKIESCAKCDVFKANMDKDGKTLHFIAEQFRVYHDKVLKAHKKAVQELANPVIQIWEGVLVLPLVGVIDRVRAVWMRDALLEGIVKIGAFVVIIDITGVPVVDSEAAEELVKTVQAVKMLGASCVLVGISPEISQTLGALGVDLSGVSTRSTLKSGLEAAFRLLRLRVVSI